MNKKSKKNSTVRTKILRAAHRGNWARRFLLVLPAIVVEGAFVIRKFPALVFGRSHHTFLHHAERKSNGRIVSSYTHHQQFERFARAGVASVLVFGLLLLTGAYYFQGTAVFATETFTVNSGNDINDGTCDGAHCSLREAITAANASSDPNKIIQFAIPTSDPGYQVGTDGLADTDDDYWQITVTDLLPNLSGGGIFVDGTSQTDAASDAQPEVVLTYTGSNPAHGLGIYSSNNEVAGLAFNDFTTFSVFFSSSSGTISGNNIHDNYIGTNVYGTASQPTPSGFPGISLYADTPSNNITDTNIHDNLLSGNGVGVELHHSDGAGQVSNTTIQNNRIGTNPDGTSAVPNTEAGISIDGVTGSNTITGNQIAGNVGYGIQIINGATNTVVTNNKIGVNPTVDAALSNTLAGILIASGANNNTIGENSANSHNVISGHTFTPGIIIDGSDTANNTIIGNFIGTNRVGDTVTAPLPNQDGIVIRNGAHDNTIGGTNAGTDCTAGPCNVIAGNSVYEIQLDNGDNNTIAGNFIGTIQDGSRPISFTTSSERAIAVEEGSSGNTIGGTNSFALAALENGNLIAGYGDNGAAVLLGGSSNAFYGNYLGTNPSGVGVDNFNNTTGAAGSDSVNDLQNEIGINAQGSSNAVGAGNFTDLNSGTFRGNLFAGSQVGIVLEVPMGNTVAGNLVGTTVDGTAAVSNSGGILYVGCPVAQQSACDAASDTQITGNLVAGATVDDGNPLGSGVGIVLGDVDADFAADNVVVSNNYIGVDITGTEVLGNENGGIGLLNDEDVVIEQNVIAGTDHSAIAVSPFTSRHTNARIRNNKIGTNAAGTASLGNGDAGIDLQSGSDHYTITDNIISGNSNAGIAGGGSDHVIKGNLVGVGADGSTTIPNAVGLDLRNLTSSVVGGTAPGEPNVISGNGQVGLRVEGGQDVTIAGNLIGTGTSGDGNVANGGGGLELINGSNLTITNNTIKNNTTDEETLYTASATPVRFGGVNYTDLVEGSCTSGSGVNTIFFASSVQLTRGVFCTDGQVFLGANGAVDVEVSAITSGGGQHYTFYWTKLAGLITDCSGLLPVVGGGTCDATQTLFTQHGSGNDYTFNGYSGGLSAATGATTPPTISATTLTRTGGSAVGLVESANISNNTFISNEGAGFQLVNTRNLDLSNNTFTSEVDNTSDLNGEYTISHTSFTYNGHDYKTLSTGEGIKVWARGMTEPEEVHSNDAHAFDSIDGTSDFTIALTKSSSPSSTYYLSNTPFTFGGTSHQKIPFGGGSVDGVIAIPDLDHITYVISPATSSALSVMDGTQNMHVALTHIAGIPNTIYLGSNVLANFGLSNNCAGVVTFLGMIAGGGTCENFKANFLVAQGAGNNYSISDLNFDNGAVTVTGGFVSPAALAVGPSVDTYHTLLIDNAVLEGTSGGPYSTDCSGVDALLAQAGSSETCDFVAASFYQHQEAGDNFTVRTYGTPGSDFPELSVADDDAIDDPAITFTAGATAEQGYRFSQHPLRVDGQDYDTIFGEGLPSGISFLRQGNFDSITNAGGELIADYVGTANIDVALVHFNSSGLDIYETLYIEEGVLLGSSLPESCAGIEAVFDSIPLPGGTTYSCRAFKENYFTPNGGTPNDYSWSGLSGFTFTGSSAPVTLAAGYDAGNPSVVYDETTVTLPAASEPDGQGIIINGGDDIALSGLTVNDNPDAGLVIANASNIVVTASTISGNQEGIQVDDGDAVTLGGADSARLEVIDNALQGIAFTGTNSTITGNFIGIHADGSSVGQNDGDGLVIRGSDNTISNNVISGNGESGIAVQSNGNTSDNTIQGNFIGTNGAGTSALANQANGIDLGGDGSNTVVENVISGHSAGSGIELTSSNNRIRGNKIGTNTTGSGALANDNGIFATSGSGNIIGTDADGSNDAAEANVISGNNSVGVALSDAANGNTIAGNFIGTTSAGDTALPNQVGVGLQGVSSTTIGSCVAGAGNVISANPQANIYIQGAGTDATVLTGNKIGTNAAGSAALGSSAVGIFAQGQSVANPIAQTTIGGCSDVVNVIAGNDSNIFTNNTVDTVIAGNHVGVAISGTTGIASRVNIAGSNNDNMTIGGNSSAERNIVGSADVGILVGGDNIAIVNNHIGTGTVGTEDLGNNVFSVLLTGNSADSTVTDNLIRNHKNDSFGSYITAPNALAYQGQNFDDIIADGFATANDCASGATSGTYLLTNSGALRALCDANNVLLADMDVAGTDDLAVSLLQIEPPTVTETKRITIYHPNAQSCEALNSSVFGGAASCVTTQDSILQQHGANSSLTWNLTNADLSLVNSAVAPGLVATALNGGALTLLNTTGGQLRDNSINTNAGAGIALRGVSGAQMTGNTIESNTLSGIELSLGSQDNIIGSLASPNTVSQNSASGVLLEGPTTTGNLITANALTANALSGVSSLLTHVAGSEGSSDNEIVDNVISQNSANGVYNRGASPAITGNTISNNGDNGIANFVDFGSNADPATANDDTVSRPLIGSAGEQNVLSSNNNNGIYSLDTAPQNAATIQDDNVFGSNGSLGAKQDWYALVYLDEDGTPRDGGTVKIYTTSGSTPVENFTTGSNGFGPTSASLTDARTWMTLTQYEVNNAGIRSNFTPHTVIGTGSSGSAEFAFNGQTPTNGGGAQQPGQPNEEEPSPFGNINGRYQVASVSLSIIPTTVTGSVYNDVNSNATRDSGEEAVQNALVILYEDSNGNNQLDIGTDRESARSTSLANGTFQFTNLIPAKYFVQLDASSLGNATVTTTNPVGVLDLSTEGSTASALFGVHFTVPQVPVSISGTVFNDPNQNGSKDDAENPIANARIYVYSDNNGNNQLDFATDTAVSDTLTATDGTYTFTNLVAGSYFVYLDVAVLTSDQRITTTNPSTLLTLNASNSAGVVDYGIYSSEPVEQLPVDPIIPGGQTPGTFPTLLTAVGLKPSVTFNRLQSFAGNVGAPAALALGAINLFAAVDPRKWSPFARLLLDFFSEPFLLLFGRRRLPWGKVYNSLNKQPLDLAFVRLYTKSGQLIRTTVTDRTGRFRFAPEAGEYSIKANKTHFTFPSVLMAGIPLVEKSRLYLGGNFSIDERHPSFTRDVPMDPPTTAKTSREVFLLQLRHQAHLFVAYFGIVISIVNLVIALTPLTIGLFVLHVILLIIFWRLAASRKPKPWGMVYDQQTKKPVKGAIVRIYEQRFGRLLETKITNRKGQYGFLVGPASYYITVEAAGYKIAANKKRPKDYVGGPILIRADEPQINYDIPLQKN